MVMIRFSRIGKKKQVFFRLIVSDKAKDTQGHYLELVGNYNPHTKQAVLKADRIKYWIGVGAQLSNSVNNLLVKEGIIEAKKMKSVNITKKRHEKIEKARPKADEPKVEEAKAGSQPLAEEAPVAEQTAEPAVAESEPAKE